MDVSARVRSQDTGPEGGKERKEWEFYYLVGL